MSPLNPGSLPSDGSYLVSEPALQRLLHNFARDESFYQGTGLVYPAVQATGAGVQVVSRDHARIVEVCRQVDVGKAYQTHLDELLDSRAASALAEDARCAFDLATQLVRTKRLLPEAEASLLLDLSAGRRPSHPSVGHWSRGELSLLGATLTGVWVVELRKHFGQSPVPRLPATVGVLLLVPNDEHHPVRHFSVWSAANDHLVQTLRVADGAAAMLQYVALQDRAAFMNMLQLRMLEQQRSAPSSGRDWSAVRAPQQGRAAHQRRLAR
ncbi:dermonecrotic toxin domain-containing protein [Pseudomonas plecoglossicida]|uniref:dermonecrotic toxin domain-containing protein n=1 Tax=Pseudomonas plecoglossicida TaxID=70775 RepID=UPI0035C14F07